MNTKYQITILGGTNGFGKWLAQYIVREFHQYVTLTITGRNSLKGRQVASELGVSFTDDNISAVRDADVVIYSTPIAHTQKIIEETIGQVKAGAVLSDVTSIKGFPSSAMSIRDDIIVIPTHPMFGPYITSIAGQVFVLTPINNSQNTQEYIFLEQYLKQQKARVIESTPEYHDKMMAVVQGLTHMNMFVIGGTMKQLGFNIADSMNFISPIYKLMISSVGRYLGQNPGLYADIQMYNSQVTAVHETFLDTAHTFYNAVKSKDYDAFCSDIITAREFLGEENCNEGQEYTDKVIYMMGAQIEILKNNIGKTIGLKNIYTRETIEGVLEKYQGGKIFLSTGNVYNIDGYEVIELKK